jgi:hypothetical protein
MILWYTPGHTLKECKSAYNRDICIPLFITELFTIAKVWNQLRSPSTDKQTEKCDIYTHNGYI